MPVFKINRDLTYINIADCKIDGATCTELCKKILKYNKKLKSLLLRNSPIGNEGAESVANLIQNH